MISTQRIFGISQPPPRPGSTTSPLAEPVVALKRTEALETLRLHFGRLLKVSNGDNAPPSIRIWGEQRASLDDVADLGQVMRRTATDVVSAIYELRPSLDQKRVDGYSVRTMLQSMSDLETNPMIKHALEIVLAN